jgi:putative aldouronate transport system permease protein
MQHIKSKTSETVFDFLNHTFMIMLIVITIYPFLYIIFASFSEPAQLYGFRGLLYKPLGFDLVGYRLVLANRGIKLGYLNTLFYVIVGTAINMFLTILAAYALSQKKFLLKKFFMIMITFTMFFSGGLIPLYMLVRQIGLYDSRLAVILPTALSVYNMIIMRTSFSRLPDSIEESAKIDGANDLVVLVRIVLPLSSAVVSVMVLFYAVAHWNAWFHALIFLRDREKYPLQLFLREILIAHDTDQISGDTDTYGTAIAQIIKYSCIVVAALPVMCLYPFLQKYFVKGVMIGSLKE